MGVTKETLNFLYYWFNIWIWNKNWSLDSNDDWMVYNVGYLLVLEKPHDMSNNKKLQHEYKH